MNITIIKPEKNVPRIATGRNAVSSSPYQERYGCWGVVLEADSTDMTVKVQLDTGIVISSLRVASMEWANEEEGYVSGSRNLPRRGSQVFIFMPTGKTEGAFVLCSGMTVLDTTQRDAFMAADDDEKEEFNNIRETVLPGNWKQKYYYETGNFELVSPDEKTSIMIDLEASNPTAKVTLFDDVVIEVKDTDSAKITAYNNIVTLKKDEATVKSKKLIVDADGLEVNGNTKAFVTHTELDTALQSLVASINAHTHITSGMCAMPSLVTSGTATPMAVPLTLDISSSKTTTIKTGG